MTAAQPEPHQLPDPTEAPTAATERVVVDDGIVSIRELSTSDAAVREALRRVPSAERAQAVHRMLEIGARAMVSSSIGVDLEAIDERVVRVIERSTSNAERRIEAILSETDRILQSSLDPDTRTSTMSRALDEMQSVRASITEAIDPQRSDSHVGALLASLTAMLGPGGSLEDRLAEALDPSSDSSGLAAVRRSVEHGFGEVRELLAERRGRRDEAEAGTRKGFDFEDVIEETLREWAAATGALVERTSASTGGVGDDLVGDFVVDLPGGASVVVEAKNTGRVGLNGASGILAELDRALSNRNAQVAVCVSATDAFPTEVGVIGAYGNRVLVVDDGDGTMLRVALRWAEMIASSSSGRDGRDVDLDAVSGLIERMRRMATAFSTHKRALTDSVRSVNKVRDGLDDMRRELLSLLDDIDAELERRADPPLRAVASR